MARPSPSFRHFVIGVLLGPAVAFTARGASKRIVITKRTPMP